MRIFNYPIFSIFEFGHYFERLVNIKCYRYKIVEADLKPLEKFKKQYIAGYEAIFRSTYHSSILVWLVASSRGNQRCHLNFYSNVACESKNKSAI